MSNDNDRRRPYGGSRAQGPARRTYAEGNAPRVGRVARNVPRAERVDGETQPERADSRSYRGNGYDRDPRKSYERNDRDYRRDYDRNDRRDYDRGDRRDYRGGDRDFDRRDRRDHDRDGVRDFRRSYDRDERNDRDRDFDRPARERRGADLHRGGAYRAQSGPRDRYREDERDDAPMAEFDGATPGEDQLLAGRNPIREALKAGRPIEKLLVAAGDMSGSGREIVRMAREAGVVVQQVERSRLDQIYPAHQGMLAYVAAVPYTPLEDILAAARAKGEDPFLILLDGVTDPHNLGAIIRSAECAGAHGVVVPERRAAGLSPAAAKAAAGALSHMPIARVKNLNRAIEQLQAENVWVVGTAMAGEDALSADLSGPIALVIGSEGDGMARLTLEKCDRTVSLPMKGHIESLNASVAAGILMYQIVRARAK